MIKHKLKTLTVLLLVLIIFGNITAQNNTKKKVENLIVDTLQLVVDRAREKQQNSANKRKEPISCFKFVSPIFNPYNITFEDKNTPVCHDFPLIDVARDVPNPKFAQSAMEYKAVRKFNAGDQIVVLLYVNNGADSSLPSSKTIAKNVKIRTSLTRENGLHALSATYTGDDMRTITGELNINIGKNEDLEIIPNSGFMYNYQGRIILDSQELNLGNSSYDLGDLDAGVQYSLFLTYKIKVISKLK